METFTQKELAEWAVTNAKRYTGYIDIGDNDLKNEIISGAEKTLNERKEGVASAYDLRQAGFLANKLSQKSQSEISKYAARVFAQAIATGHMRGHAIASSDYAIRVVNLEDENERNSIIKERDKQIGLAYKMKN